MIDLSWNKVRNEDEDEHEHADEDSGESTYVLELPAKINVLKLEEAAEVLKIMIKRDHTKRGLKGKRILYKNPSWEPSFCTSTSWCCQTCGVPVCDFCSFDAEEG